MLVIIDNYDSFTYNLVQRFGEIGLDDPALRQDIRVVRNDEMNVEQIADLKPRRLVISPGPCTPNEGGVSNDAVRHFCGKLPVLGVCLGHQCIGQVFGGKIVRADRIMHGKTSEIHHDGRTIFAGLANPFTATRYHSLAVDTRTLDGAFEISARTEQDEVMAFRHRSEPLEGVQFHPESFLTTEGTKLLSNFLRM